MALGKVGKKLLHHRRIVQPLSRVDHWYASIRFGRLRETAVAMKSSLPNCLLFSVAGAIQTATLWLFGQAEPKGSNKSLEKEMVRACSCHINVLSGCKVVTIAAAFAVWPKQSVKGLF